MSTVMSQEVREAFDRELRVRRFQGEDLNKATLMEYFVWRGMAAEKQARERCQQT